MDAEAHKSIAIVQKALAAFQAGSVQGYMDLVHDDFKGDILAGLVPGGEKIVGKPAFEALNEAMGKTLEVKKFEASNWTGVGNHVFFTVDWSFVYKPTGKTVDTTAVVLKIIKDGKICEKYHRVNAEAVLAAKSSPAAATDVKETDAADGQASLAVVQSALDQYMAGKPEGYFAMLPEDFKGDVLAGLVPAGADITSKASFTTSVMEEMQGVMEVKKFAPANFAAVGENVFFTVDWEFEHTPTGLPVALSAVVRKVVRNGQICEKYHRINSAELPKAPASASA